MDRTGIESVRRNDSASSLLFSVITRKLLNEICASISGTYRAVVNWATLDEY